VMSSKDISNCLKGEVGWMIFVFDLNSIWRLRLKGGANLNYFGLAWL
jgi:hypothetical protein